MPDFIVRPLVPADRGWIDQAMLAEWCAPVVAVHERLYRPSELPGFAAEAGGTIAGLLTYHVEGHACEIVTLNAWRQGMGIGSALIEAAKQAARQAECRRLWLITTNDNLPALRFYQKRGLVIAAIHVNAIEHDRRLKPEIPLTGLDGIPIRDEIELELPL